MFVCAANGKKNFNVQLELRDHSLLIVPNEDSNKYSVPNKERVITLSRKADGGFGVAIKGGKEHNLPIIISKILRSDLSSIKLYIGDAILKVNETSTRGLSREQVIDLLRNSGDKVVLTVKHYKEVASLLKKDEEQGKCLDLSFAYVQEMEEQRAFKLQPSNSKDETVFQCSDKDDREMWLKLIVSAVQRRNDQKIEYLNKNLEEVNRIHWMDWISKKCYFPWNRQRTLPLFLAFKGGCVFQFDRAPTSLAQFEECQVVYRAYQCSLVADRDCIDPAPKGLGHYVLETPHHCIRFSLNGCIGRAAVERSWTLCTYVSVITLSSKTFSVHFESKPASLTIDWNMGFALYDIASKEYLWKYGFGQYRRSSYDQRKVKIVFAINDTDRNSELGRTVTLATDALAKQLVFCINAFLSSKSAAPFK